MSTPAGMTFLPDEPIIIMNPERMNILKLTPEQRQQMEAAVQARVTETPGTDYYILNMADTTIDFSEMVLALGRLQEIIREIGGAEYVNAELGVIIAGPVESAGLMAAALGQEQYGGITAHHVETVDEALAYARERIREESG